MIRANTNEREEGGLLISSVLRALPLSFSRKLIAGARARCSVFMHARTQSQREDRKHRLVRVEVVS